MRLFLLPLILDRWGDKVVTESIQTFCSPALLGQRAVDVIMLMRVCLYVR